MRGRNLAEIVIGVLYAIGAVAQTVSTLPQSEQYYTEMAARAWFPPAQWFVEELLIPNSAVVTVLVIAFEAAVAIAILTRRTAVQPALLAGGVFSIVGAITGSPAETIGYGILAVIHFRLAALREREVAV
jgi:hypothetical protein